MNPNKDHSIAHLTATLNGVLNDSVFWTNRLSQRFNDPCTNICLILDESAVWMNDSMTRLIKPLITCICAHYRQTNQICSKLFFLNQSKHILIFIQELCIYKTIAFYDSSLVIKKICKFFFSGFFSSHPVAYSRPPGRVSAPPPRLRTTVLDELWIE